MSLLVQLQQIDQWHRQIAEQGKLSDKLLKKINYKFRLDWNYYSNSMEGNSLTRQETRSVMVGNITVDGKPIKDVLEMKGHDDVITRLLKMGQGELNLSEKRIKEIHKGIMHEDDPEKVKQIGQWKFTANHLINYKGEKFDFVAPADVPERMHKLINWLNTEKEKIARKANDALHPALLAFQFHLDYVSIHPFFDGNGRTARIFTNLILIAYGYPPIYIKTDEKTRYYQYLADIQGYGGSPELYYEFMAGLLLRSLGIVKDAMEGKEIEEQDDWEKKLSLLKQDLLVNGVNQLNTAAPPSSKVYSGIVSSTIEKAVQKFSKFNELFKEVRVEYQINKEEIIAFSTLEKLTNDLDRVVNPQMIEFWYLFNNLKVSPTSVEIEASIIWYFYQDNYLLRTSEGYAYKNDYSQVISEEHADQILNYEADKILGKIQTHLRRNRLKF